MNGLETDLRERFERAGQGHVFAHWETLPRESRACFAAELARLDLEQVSELARVLREDPHTSRAPQLAPPKVFPLERSESQAREAREAVERGEELLRAGLVGYLLVAGGQASRLGHSGPKGALAIGPVSGRSLFEMHARRLRAARHRYGTVGPWYVMTSPANHDATRAYFEAERFFGLARDDVHFFSQDMLPAMDRDGRILLASESALFLAPNGHGGVLLAMQRSGALADAKRRGLVELSYFQVDNPLARPADPLFLGLHSLARADMSSKVVDKRDAHEKVGVLARIDGRLGCIEYSDLPRELAEARDAEGRLVFRAGNIAIHALRVDFVDRLTRGGLKLPWHLARKRMKVFERGAYVEREGVKFETFVFDALAEARASITLEVDRRAEFSPVKNAEGTDSPQTARADLCRLHSAWARKAGHGLPDPDEHGVAPVEIDPLVAEDEDAFLRAQPLKPLRSERGHLYDHERR
jgi:UDP-N-acetylglucosamine/UDP-N-acetylgalactosamine diphosphorylase